MLFSARGGKLSCVGKLKRGLLFFEYMWELTIDDGQLTMNTNNTKTKD